MQSEARETFMQAASQKAAFDAHDARADRNEREATELVLAYMVSVATLYKIPMCYLNEHLTCRVLEDWGNG